MDTLLYHNLILALWLPETWTSAMIHLYTAQSPNGHKISITLEELGLPYDITVVELGKMAHKEPWFLAINPNGRIPALTDELPDKTPVSLFESGSIQQYLIDNYDPEHKLSYPKGTKEYYETNNWVRQYIPAFGGRGKACILVTFC